jgi:hypothetical protein
MLTHEPPYPAAINAPTNVIPEIAFEPDMRGVCNVAGTFEISSTPKKIERARINAKKTGVMEGSLLVPS